MKVTFHADDPRKKARPLLEGLLRCGTDQLMIACAFCTSEGSKKGRSLLFDIY